MCNQFHILILRNDSVFISCPNINIYTYNINIKNDFKKMDDIDDSEEADMSETAENKDGKSKHVLLVAHFSTLRVPCDCIY